MSELKKYTNKQEPDNEIKKPYLEVASWQSVAGVGLSMVGTMFILVVLWITALYVITNTKFNERSFNTMAVVSGVVIFWIPLRIYSEWYLNFGYYEKSNYSTLYIANVVAVVWFVLISVLRADRSVAKIIAAVSGVAAGAMSFAGWLQPKWVEEGAGLVFGLGTTYLIVVYMTLFAAVVLIAYYLQGEASIEQQPHQDI
jgi:hypothetical protein